MPFGRLGKEGDIAWREVGLDATVWAVEIARMFPMLLVIEAGKFGARAGLEPWRLAEDPKIY